MSELRSAVEPFRAESLPELPVARIEEDLAELQRTSDLIEVERLRRIAELDRRGAHERDGHLSFAGWLVERFRTGWGAARREVHLARSLDAMPETREALVEGDLSLAAVRVLASTRDAHPEAFERAEPMLV